MVETPTLDVVSAERRRPGRADVYPALVPLFRGEAVSVGRTDGEPVTDAHDDLAPARGIALLLFLSVPFWAVLCGVAAMALR